MSLRDSVTAALRRLIGQPATEATQHTSIDETLDPEKVKSIFNSNSRARRDIIRECRDMYEGDTRAAGVIKAVANDVAKNGFTIAVKGNSKAQDIANRLHDRLSLPTRIDDWVRMALRDGDCFLEIGVDEARQIAAISRKPTLEIVRNTNRLDRFEDPMKAFWWKDDLVGMLDEPPSDATFFAQWQIVHARYDHDEGMRYGRPLFASATRSYKRMSEGENDMAIRRKTRAGMKFLHVVEGADEGQIKQYRKRNEDALRNPFAAVADFFTNKPGAISSIQGDANLGQFEDVVHHIRTWWVAAPIPMSLLGYGQDLNRDVLDEQKEKYDERVEQITEWVNADIVKPILHLEWLLNGILPADLDYEITWKSKSHLTPAMLRDIADAGIRLKTLGVDDKTVLALISRFVPDVDMLKLSTLSGSPAETQPGAIAGAAAGAAGVPAGVGARRPAQSTGANVQR